MRGKNAVNADAFASILTMQWRKNTHPKRVRILMQLLKQSVQNKKLLDFCPKASIKYFLIPNTLRSVQFCSQVYAILPIVVSFWRRSRQNDLGTQNWREARKLEEGSTFVRRRVMTKEAVAIVPGLAKNK